MQPLCHQVNLFLAEIAARLNAGKLRGVKCVPASDVAASEAAFHGVPLTTLQASRGRWELGGAASCQQGRLQQREATA